MAHQNSEKVHEPWLESVSNGYYRALHQRIKRIVLLIPVQGQGHVQLHAPTFLSRA